VENQQQPGPGPEHEALEVIIGKWINEGHTVATEDAQSARIITSDVYERSTGGFFVLHTAYGRAGDLPVAASRLSDTTRRAGGMSPASSTAGATRARTSCPSKATPAPGGGRARAAR
jgi:hypothetical protein